jgi:hypothetical protein
MDVVIVIHIQLSAAFTSSRVTLLRLDREYRTIDAQEPVVLISSGPTNLVHQVNKLYWMLRRCSPQCAAVSCGETAILGEPEDVGCHLG